jgi:hypothetical protein
VSARLTISIAILAIAALLPFSQIMSLGNFLGVIVAALFGLGVIASVLWTLR